MAGLSLFLSVQLSFEPSFLGGGEAIILIGLDLVFRREKSRIGLDRKGRDEFVLFSGDTHAGNLLLKIELRRFPRDADQFALVENDEILDHSEGTVRQASP